MSTLCFLKQEQKCLSNLLNQSHKPQDYFITYNVIKNVIPITYVHLQRCFSLLSTAHIGVWHGYVIIIDLILK